MDTIRRILKSAELSGNPSMRIRVVTVEKMLQDYGDRGAMITAFRHAANSIGVEAGITKDHVSHDVAVASVCGDHLYIEMISEAEERFKRLSVKYERLRAAVSKFLTESGGSIRTINGVDIKDGLRETFSND
jgi:hypothetical protein